MRDIDLEDVANAIYLNEITGRFDRITNIVDLLHDLGDALGDDGNGTYSQDTMDKNVADAKEELRKGLYE